MTKLQLVPIPQGATIKLLRNELLLHPVKISSDEYKTEKGTFACTFYRNMNGKLQGSYCKGRLRQADGNIFTYSNITVKDPETKTFITCVGRGRSGKIEKCYKTPVK